MELILKNEIGAHFFRLEDEPKQPGNLIAFARLPGDRLGMLARFARHQRTGRFHGLPLPRKPNRRHMT